MWGRVQDLHLRTFSLVYKADAFLTSARIIKSKSNQNQAQYSCIFIMVVDHDVKTLFYFSDLGGKNSMNVRPNLQFYNEICLGVRFALCTILTKMTFWSAFVIKRIYRGKLCDKNSIAKLVKLPFVHQIVKTELDLGHSWSSGASSGAISLKFGVSIECFHQCRCRLPRLEEY